MEEFSTLNKFNANKYINKADMKHDMSDAGVNGNVIQSYNTLKYGSITDNAIEDVSMPTSNNVSTKLIKDMLYHLLVGGAIDQMPSNSKNIINRPKKKDHLI